MWRHSHKGFSLIEVVIAIAIIAMIYVATTRFLQIIPPTSGDARNEDLALKIASNEMETLRAGGYDVLPPSESFTSSLLSSLPSGAAALVVTDYDTQTKRVDITVSWQGVSLTNRSLSLTTLIAKNSGLP